MACYRKMGLDDCLADSAEDYVEIAVRLATDADWRTEVSRAIRDRSAVLYAEKLAVAETERLLHELVATARRGGSG